MTQLDAIDGLARLLIQNEGEVIARLRLSAAEAARVCNVTPRQLIYWTKKGIIKPSPHDEHDYDIHAMEKVIRIRQALERGYSLEKAAQVVDREIAAQRAELERLNAMTADVLEEELRQRLERLEERVQQLRRTLPASLTLARFPEQRAKLVDRPELIGGAVEELLRYDAPSPVQGRYTLRDVTYHDTLIPAGSRVALLTGSAGRDERQYENPDVFDVERTGIRHVSFGHGSHFCLGAALARLEAHVALEETLARFPTWDVDEDAVTYVHTNSVRGPASVPIRL